MGAEISTDTTIPIGRHEVRMKRKLGEGGYAFVFLVEDIRTGQEFALKRLLAQNQEQNRIASMEIDLMKKFSHPNIVTYHGACRRPAANNATEYFILMEFCPGGSFIDIIKKRMGRPFAEKHVFRVFRDICRGVQQLHEMNPPVAHRDLKVENILLAIDGLFKLCDFGSCTTRAGTYKTRSEIVDEEERIERYTTMMYRAPEMADLHRHYHISEKVDIWALGTILYTIAFFQHPFQDGGSLSIISGKFHVPEKHGYSDFMMALMRKLMTVDPEERPDIHGTMLYVRQWGRYLELDENKRQLPEELEDSLLDLKIMMDPSLRKKMKKARKQKKKDKKKKSKRHDADTKRQAAVTASGFADDDGWDPFNEDSGNAPAAAAAAAAASTRTRKSKPKVQQQTFDDFDVDWGDDSTDTSSVQPETTQVTHDMFELTVSSPSNRNQSHGPAPPSGPPSPSGGSDASSGSSSESDSESASVSVSASPSPSPSASDADADSPRRRPSRRSPRTPDRRQSPTGGLKPPRSDRRNRRVTRSRRSAGSPSSPRSPRSPRNRQQEREQRRIGSNSHRRNHHAKQKNKKNARSPSSSSSSASSSEFTSNTSGSDSDVPYEPGAGRVVTAATPSAQPEWEPFADSADLASNTQPAQAPSALSGDDDDNDGDFDWGEWNDTDGAGSAPVHRQQQRRPASQGNDVLDLFDGHQQADQHNRPQSAGSRVTHAQSGSASYSGARRTSGANINAAPGTAPPGPADDDAWASFDFE
jgi:serine/threonine protein kinase